MEVQALAFQMYCVHLSLYFPNLLMLQIHVKTNELAETKPQTGDNLQVINMWFDKEIRRAHSKLEVAEHRYFTLYLML